MASYRRYYKGMDLDCNLDISGIVIDQCSIPVGSDDYNGLVNKPKINGVTLIGDKSSAEIHVQHEMAEITPQQIDRLIYGG